jgi:hypothetical protein
MIVEDGPTLLNLDVPKRGKTRFAVMPEMEDMNIPRKQYLIWRRSNPTEFLYDFIKKNSAVNMVINTYAPKIG